LTILWCGINQLTTLDLSQNSALVNLGCEDNHLVCLNLRNGNNTIINGMFSAAGNLQLTCIEVDDVAFSDANWVSPSFLFDSQSFFSTNCNNGCFVGLGSLSASSKVLVKIVNLLGRETTFKPNTPLIYVYDDGTSEKMFAIE